LSGGDSVINQVQFHNTGPDQIPGLIVMSIADDPENPVDTQYDLVLVLFNADVESMDYQLPDRLPTDMEIHPGQINSTDNRISPSILDAAASSIELPSQSTVVLVHRRPVESEPEISETIPEIDETQTVAETDTAPPADEGNPIFSTWLLPGGIGVLLAAASLLVVFLRRRGLLRKRS
jgi:hypothetical protein